MASARKSQWKTFQRFAENLVFDRAPRLARHVQNSQTVLRELQQAVKITANVIAAAAPQPPAITAGRPVTSTSFPTAQRARKLVYAPDLDGRADPGEIVWTWVVYEDDPTRGKDRPVLVVGRDRRVLLGLMVSSRERHADDRDWVGIGCWRLGLRGQAELGSVGPGARRARREHSPRGRDPGSRDLRPGGRAVARGLLLELTRGNQPCVM